MAFLYALQNPKKWNDYLRIYNMSDDELFQTTRFPRQSVHELIDLLHDDLTRHTERSHAVPVDTQVLTALQFYSTGSFQWMVGRSTGLSQLSVSRVITGVTDALCKLADKSLCFPLHQQALTDSKQAFSAIAGFGNVIGSVDCTHIPIKSPSVHEEAYVNRKGVHTINVQAVCDANMRFLDVVAKWPGATHDSFIWRSSSLRELFEGGHIQGGWLLGMLKFSINFMQPGKIHQQH